MTDLTEDLFKKSPRKARALQKLLEGPGNPWFHFPLLLVHILVSNFFFLYTTSIQWRESELIAVLLQVHSSSEISGSACDYQFPQYFALIKVSASLWFKKQWYFLSSAVFFSGALFFCSPVHCFCLSASLSLLWGTALFLSSQVVNKGGIQFQECSLIGWFGKFGWFSYPLSFSPSSFSFSGVFPTTFLPSPHTVWQQGKVFLSRLLSDKHVFLDLF